MLYNSKRLGREIYLRFVQKASSKKGSLRAWGQGSKIYSRAKYYKTSTSKFNYYITASLFIYRIARDLYFN